MFPALPKPVYRGKSTIIVIYEVSETEDYRLYYWNQSKNQSDILRFILPTERFCSNTTPIDSGIHKNCVLLIKFCQKHWKKINDWKYVNDIEKRLTGVNLLVSSSSQTRLPKQINNNSILCIRVYNEIRFRACRELIRFYYYLPQLKWHFLGTFPEIRFSLFWISKKKLENVGQLSWYVRLRIELHSIGSTSIWLNCSWFERYGDAGKVEKKLRMLKMLWISFFEGKSELACPLWLC